MQIQVQRHIKDRIIDWKNLRMIEWKNDRMKEL